MFSPHASVVAVQDYLNSGKSLEDFKKEHGIVGKTDGDHLLLDYDMTSVNWQQPFGYACRGLVLCADTLEVLGFGLPKFFNSGEGYAANINWSSAKVLEKLDGTMVKRWFSKKQNQFCYSTRRQLPGEIEKNKIGDTSVTWKQLIERCLGDLEIDQKETETFVFEVMSPVNAVVVRHKDFSASLIACRCNRTFQEFDISQHYAAPKVFSFSRQEEVEEFAKTLKGVECEGFVVLDDKFNRIKIKGEDYVNLHHLKDGATRSVKHAILTARRGEVEEVSSYFPELEEMLRGIENIIKEFVHQHAAVYEEIKDISSQKEFAITLNRKGLVMPALLFNVRAGKAESVQEAMNQLDDNKFVKYIKPLVDKARLTSFGMDG